MAGTDEQRVDCPDLLGHGWAPHRPPYTIERLAQHLAESLNEQYDVIGGVSFGSTVAAALYPLLATKPKRLVLAEPLLDHPPFPQTLIDGAVAGTKDIPTEEAILKGNPTWIPAEATLRRMSLTQIDPEVIKQLFQVRLAPTVPNALTEGMVAADKIRLSTTVTYPTPYFLPLPLRQIRRSSSSLATQTYGPFTLPRTRSSLRPTTLMSSLDRGWGRVMTCTRRIRTCFME